MRVVASDLIELAKANGFESVTDAITVAKKSRAEIDRLRAALEQSVKLQSHYAGLLNAYDSGERICFADAQAWLDRLRTLGLC